MGDSQELIEDHDSILILLLREQLLQCFD
jgi:hypothetical protein